MRYCTICKKFIFTEHYHQDQGSNYLKEIDMGTLKYTSPKKEIKAERIFSDEKCPECDAKKLSVIVKQIRGLDEAPTVFTRCFSCDYSRKDE